MTAPKNKVIRTENGIEQVDFPRWDRFGNLVQPKKKKQKPVTDVEDVKEETVQVPTLKDVEEIRETAYNEGFEQGYENGLKQGVAEGQTQGKKQGYDEGFPQGETAGRDAGKAQALAEEQKKTDEKLAVFNQISVQLRDQIALEQTELEQALLAMAIRIARQVVQDELVLSPDHIQTVVHAAVQSLPNPDDKLSIKLNESDIEVVRAIADSHWTLEPDASVAVGGCVIKSGFSYVDFTLEHRFENAVHHLLAGFKEEEQAVIATPLSDATLVQNRKETSSTAAESPEPSELNELTEPLEPLERSEDSELSATKPETAEQAGNSTHSNMKESPEKDQETDDESDTAQ